MLNRLRAALAMFLSSCSMPGCYDSACFFRSTFRLRSRRFPGNGPRRLTIYLLDPGAAEFTSRTRRHTICLLAVKSASQPPPGTQLGTHLGALLSKVPHRPDGTQSASSPSKVPHLAECPRVTTSLSGVACVLLGTRPLPSLLTRRLLHRREEAHQR